MKETINNNPHVPRLGGLQQAGNLPKQKGALICLKDWDAAILRREQAQLLHMTMTAISRILFVPIKRVNLLYSF